MQLTGYPALVYDLLSFCWRPWLKGILAGFLGLLVVLPSLTWAADASGGSSSTGYKPNYRYSGPGGGTVTEEEVKGKDPILATGLAVMPGVLVHGFGNYYAEDYRFGNRMLAMQIAGMGLAVWGYSLEHAPGNWQAYFGGDDNTQMVGYWVKAGGVGLIVLSWLGDIATASDAALQYNHEHQINFQLESDLHGPRIMLSYKF
jgi:hypothetical protein